MKFLACFALIFGAHEVTDAQQYSVISATASSVPASETVELTCEFTNKWLEETHPLAYPTANAHWSPMIIASHSSDYTMWADGDLASPAMQIVAETGVKLTLLGELDNSSSVLAQQSGRAQYNAQQQSQALNAINVDSDHPFISTATKISPSPDWFTGFTDFSILDTESNTWFASIQIDTFPWDAGTDSGTFYRSENMPTDPPRPITQIEAENAAEGSRGLPQDGVFLSPDGTTVLPVASWTCSVAAAAPSPTAAGATPTTAAPTAAPTLPPEAATTAAAPVSSPPTVAPTEGPTKTPTAAPTAPPTSTPTTAPPTPRPTSQVIPFNIVSSVPGNIPSAVPIGVSCMITNEWTISRHPKDYPEATAQWSPMVVASHSQEFQMWGNGQIASAGVQSIATSGNPGLMVGELMIADEGVLDYHQGSAMKVSVRQNETIVPVRLDKDHHLVSTIASVMPSPDWFSGCYDLDMLNTATGTWFDKVVIETYPWDAGTDSGETYTAGGAATLPKYLITQFTVGTVPETGVFLSPDGDDVFPVSRWTCTRVEAPPPKATSSASSLACSFVTVVLLLVATASFF